MRFLKTLSLNRRAIYDDRLAIDTANGVVMNTPNNLLMPKGATGDRPISPSTGMIRYNTSTNEVEVYQGVGGSATWRSLRFKESTEIIQQAFIGDAETVVFGPLDPQPPTIVASGATWTGANLIVVVGNVFQTWNTNYLIVDGADTSPQLITGQKYIQFTSAPPGLSTPIVILHGFDQ
jgi:hypothetical protein